jgi:hypothetical protein
LVELNGQLLEVVHQRRVVLARQNLLLVHGEHGEGDAEEDEGAVAKDEIPDAEQSLSLVQRKPAPDDARDVLGSERRP